MARLRRVARRTSANSHAWNPRARSIDPKIELATALPHLRLEDRTRPAEKYISGLRASLEATPEGWSGGADEGQDLEARVRSRRWYHTIELPGGVVTPGVYDHRPLLPHYGIPDRLDGKRALDVGTWDGFWAFELERRGAEVVAADVDRLLDIALPAAIQRAVEKSGLDQRFGGGFEVAHGALRSTVDRRVLNIYDLDPGSVGTFDLVHVGDVLQHLEAPTRALRRVRAVTDGLAIITTSFDPTLGAKQVLRYRGGWRNAVWWTMSLSATAQMIVDAGFSTVEVGASYRIRSTTGSDHWEAVLHAAA